MKQLYTKGKTEVKPADVNYDESRLETLNNHFQKLIDDNEIYCATYCISRKGNVFAHGSIGYKSYKKDPKLLVSPTDIHYIASVTKVFTGVAIMKLVEDGITRLDIPVGEILPQFNSSPFNGINLFHLLTHTSGMHADGGCFPNAHNNEGYWHFIETAYHAYKNDKSKKKEAFDWISAALAHGVRMGAGQEWAYNSFGFCVLGEVIEKLTGIHSHKFIEDYICKPLKLKDTTFDLTPKAAERYIIHNERNEKFVKDVLDGKPIKDDKPWDVIPSTGGGMKSTVSDMNQFGNMVLYNGTFNNARILGRKAVQQMTDLAVKLPDYCWEAGGNIRQYAIGFDHRNYEAFSFSPTTVMHEGYGACALYIDPEEELVASWIVPFTDCDNWCQKAMYSTVNVIWSGLK
ncbi:MAG: beta-lactamase family protein [Oscillospiraceae bacterium]|nr:beta-lactamase family protein [Oscillospiraceae bacterium]